jgi:signal transduction histidine kinase
MGLQLIKDGDAEILGENSLIADATEACSVSVNLLNDLLMYDRIEAGNVSLDIQYVSSKPFLHKTVRLFQLQVSIMFDLMVL